MPATGLRTEFKLSTRSKFTTVDCEIGIKVNGNELPNMEVLGSALEKAKAAFEATVTESYAKVPERV